jgi:hypothetical protein
MSRVMAAFRERFNKAPPRTATPLDWKNERSLLEVLKTGRNSIVVFSSNENPNFTQELEHNPPHVTIWTCNQGVPK